MVCCTLHSASCPLVCQFRCLVSVVPLWSLWNICSSIVPLLRVFCPGFSPLCSVFFPMCPVILCRHALFGFSSDELRVTPRIFVYLLNVCKFFIWHSRNDSCFRDVFPVAVSIIAQVRTPVRFHLPLFFKRFKSSHRKRYFHRQWGTRGVVASVAAGQLTLCL